MICQTHGGQASAAKSPTRRSILVRSLWALNVVLLGVVVLAPVSRRAGTTPVDNAAGVIASVGDQANKLDIQTLRRLMGGDIDRMKPADWLVAAAPDDVSEKYAFRSTSKIVVCLLGKSSGGALTIEADGRYRGHWVNPASGEIASGSIVVRGPDARVVCPAFDGAIALTLRSTAR